MRIALGLEYDGRAYVGWQRQKSGSSIQQAVEEGLSKVANATVEVICAGRTDTQVHATQQVIHFNSDAVRDERSWVLGLNSNTPHDISALWARQVEETFHARFSAEQRSYRYIIQNRYTRPALNHKRVTWCHAALNESLMHDAAQALVGEHDFSSFRAQHCQSKSPIRRLERIAVQRIGEYVVLDVTANAFLYHMVRNIAGVLMAVGLNEQPVTWVSEILAKRDRTQGGVTAPPDGLYLTAVRYPVHYQLPEPPPLPVFA